MNLFRNFDINASALTAERLRMDLIANNIANVNTTRTAEGGPYQRQIPIFAEVLEQVKDASGQTVARGAGVRVSGIEKDTKPPRLVYDPTHPDADAQGYVAYPDINTVTEMVNMITASRAYEANVTAFNSAKDMFRTSLDLAKI